MDRANDFMRNHGIPALFQYDVSAYLNPSHEQRNQITILSSEEKQFLKERAKFGQLPDALNIHQFAFLMYPDHSRFQIALIAALTGARKYGELSDGIKRNLPSGLLTTDERINLPIHRSHYKKFLMHHDGWPVEAEGSLVSKWWQDEATDQDKAISPSKKRNGYTERNEDFLKWVEEDKPDFFSLNKTDIERILQRRNPSIWYSGFDEWYRQQNFIKGKQGRGLGVIVLSELKKHHKQQE